MFGSSPTLYRCRGEDCVWRLARPRAREKGRSAMKSAFWKTDWFLGLAVVVLMLFAGNSDLLQSLERKAYDMGVQATSRTLSDKIAVIAIDEVSLANIGRWPWSRDKLAKMVDLLAAAKVKVIGDTVLLSEAQIDPGYQYIQKLL